MLVVLEPARLIGAVGLASGCPTKPLPPNGKQLEHGETDVDRLKCRRARCRETAIKSRSAVKTVEIKQEEGDEKRSQSFFSPTRAVRTYTLCVCVCRARGLTGGGGRTGSMIFKCWQCSRRLCPPPSLPSISLLRLGAAWNPCAAKWQFASLPWVFRLVWGVQVWHTWEGCNNFTNTTLPSPLSPLLTRSGPCGLWWHFLIYRLFWNTTDGNGSNQQTPTAATGASLLWGSWSVQKTWQGRNCFVFFCCFF